MDLLTRIRHEKDMSSLRKILFQAKKKQLCSECWKCAINKDPLLILFSPKKFRNNLYKTEPPLSLFSRKDHYKTQQHENNLTYEANTEDVIRNLSNIREVSEVSGDDTDISYLFSNSYISDSSI
jgi:hypothetical protein